jgi:hypothetical protein
VPDRRGSRFLLEVVFLVGLAAALAFAHLRPAEIAGAMLLGWALVAVLEWAAWRGRPHYGSGLPPRYYVPRLNVPAAAPIQGLQWKGFPPPKPEEERTWVVSPATRTEVMGEWPFAVRGDEGPQADPWLASSLPVAPLEPGVGDDDVTDASTWAAVVAAKARIGPTALHTLDPLAEPSRSRRRGGEEVPRIEVPARPPGTRPLPRRSPAA